MKETIREVKEAFITNPIVTFMLVTLGAVWFLYNDLSQFIHSQQQILTQQVQTQQATTDLLNQISQRLAEIEWKIFDSSYQPNSAPSVTPSPKTSEKSTK